MSKNNKQEGILLCATGSDTYYQLCNTIIRDIREVMPKTSIAVYTDNEERIADADHFIQGKHYPKKVFLSKIKACRNSPFEKSIFIDVDSRVLRPVDHLFKILDKHDLGLTLAQSRTRILNNDNWDPGETGLTLCSSTLLFRKNENITELFNRWEKEYFKSELFPGKGDQVYLKYLLYHDESIRYFTLPDEYHLNSDHPTFVAGSVKIVTSLISDKDPQGNTSRKRLDEIINKSAGKERLFYFNLLGGVMKWKRVRNYIPKRILVHTLYKNKNNLISSLKKIFSYLRS